MVHTTSAIAFAVVALTAASTLARPLEYETDINVRDYEQEVDARDFDFEYDAREFEDVYEVDARDFEFGGYEFEEREFEPEFFEIVERAATTTTSSTSTPSTTTTTIVAKPTGKNKKETKTVVITVQSQPKSCKKPSLLERVKKAIKSKTKPVSGKKVTTEEKHSLKKLKHKLERKEARKERRKAARASAKSAKSSSTSTSTSTSSSTSASATATGTTTTTANWSSITPPPAPKGVKVSDKKTVGKDKVTTIMRTVTAAPTPCPVASKKSKRDLEDFEDLLERAYAYDDLD